MLSQSKQDHDNDIWIMSVDLSNQSISDMILQDKKSFGNDQYNIYLSMENLWIRHLGTIQPYDSTTAVRNGRKSPPHTCLEMLGY